MKIRNQIGLTLGAFIFFTVTAIFVVNYFLIRSNLEKRALENLERLEKAVYQASQTLLKSAITNYLRGVTESNLAQIEKIYIEHQAGRLTEVQAKRQIQKLFTSQRVGDSGYMVAVEEKGNRLYLDLHPFQAKQDCTETDGCRQWAATRNGYTEYDWKNPLDNSFRKKAAYVMEFKPWNWIVGASSYKDEFVQLVKISDLEQLVSKTTIDDTGYFFVFDSSFKVLIHPELAGSSFGRTSEDDPTRKIFQQLVDTRGFTTYVWKNPSESKPRRKYAFVEYLQDFDWYLVASGYFDEIFAPVEQLKRITVALICLSGMLLAALIYRLSASFSLPLIELASEASNFFRNRRPIVWKQKGIAEIDMLGQAFSGMTEELNHSMANLQNKVIELAISEQEKQEGRDFLHSVIDSMPSAIIGIDTTLRITFWNQQASRKSRKSISAVSGSSLEDVLPELKSHLPAITEAMTETKVQTIAYVEQTGGMPSRNIEMTIYPLQSGLTGGAVIRLDDVSERVEMEQRLRQGQKMDAVGQLAGGIAHDFNNMLSGIMGAADLLRCKLPEEQQPLAAIIVSSAERARELILKLLAFARKDKVAFVLLDVHGIIEETVAILRRTLDKKITIITELEAGYATILGDASQLHNSLLNLGINSGHAMPDGGQLRFASRVVELDAGFCGQSTFAIEPGRYLEITVSDTGCGITQEYQKRMFEPFFTTREQGKGTGLGLAAVYGTVVQHRGAISVDSEPGRGTDIRLLLPLPSGSVREIEQAEEHLVRGEGCVLIVEDEQIVRGIAKLMVERLGYHTLEAEDGRKGLELFLANRDAIDLVLLDMVMPVMDGYQCYRELRKLDGELPIVISSGFSREANLAELEQDRFSAFIRKPYKIGELSRTIAQAMKGK